MVGRTKKAQISVYLEPDIMDMLAHYAAQRDQSMSLIAQAARAKLSERYASYTRALGRRLAKGPQLRQEIEEDVARPEKD